MKNVKVRLHPIVNNINLPTVIKTAILPGESREQLFIATQVGEIFCLKNGHLNTFLDIRPKVIELGSNGGYDERGLIGLAFHPNFSYNGLFYIHYSVAGTQGPGALTGSFTPDPCNPSTLNMEWTDRVNLYDHIDTVEEWVLLSNDHPQKQRTLLNLRRPFSNHNGVNSLNFSPETGNLVLITGDGGSGYDPFNLSQDFMEIAGKVIEIDVDSYMPWDNPLVVTRFDELPRSVQDILSIIAKGVRNSTGISYQWYYNRFIKYVGNVGQDLVESIYSFVYYKPIPVTELVQVYLMNSVLNEKGFINFGWRAWEGDIPSPIIRDCSNNLDLDEKIISYYNDAVITSAKRIHPLINYFHNDIRPDKFDGTALTGVQPYIGNKIPDLTGNVLFTDLSQRGKSPAKGALAYTKPRTDFLPNDFSLIDIDYDFGNESAYYVSLGSNLDQTKLYLGVYGSTNVTDLYNGTVFEITP